MLAASLLGLAYFAAAAPKPDKLAIAQAQIRVLIAQRQAAEAAQAAQAATDAYKVIEAEYLKAQGKDPGACMVDVKQEVQCPTK